VAGVVVFFFVFFCLLGTIVCKWVSSQPLQSARYAPKRKKKSHAKNDNIIKLKEKKKWCRWQEMVREVRGCSAALR
jgi:polyferredoxin